MFKEIVKKRMHALNVLVNENENVKNGMKTKKKESKYIKRHNCRKALGVNRLIGLQT